MPRHTEPSANNALGDALRAALPSCDVRSENTRQIVDNPNLRPDILHRLSCKHAPHLTVRPFTHIKIFTVTVDTTA